MRNIDYLDGGITVSDAGMNIGDGVGNSYINPVGGGGGGSLPPITPNQFDGFNGDRNKSVRVSSNIKGASIIVDGINTFKITPNVINSLLSEILTSGAKVIRVQKEGYVSNESYQLSVLRNPDYYNGITQYNSGLSIGNQPLYSDTDPYKINVRYFVNEVEQPYDNSGNSQIVDITFNLKIGTVVDIPMTDTQTFKLTITSDLDNSAIAVKNITEKTTLVNGLNSITGNRGDVYTISSANLANYRIKAINGSSTIGVFKPLLASGTNSLNTTITLDGDYSLVIATEKVNTAPIDLPTLTLTNQNIDRTYNINSKADIPIGFTTSTNTSKVTVYVNNKPYQFTDVQNGIILPASVFSKIGNYKIALVPSNAQGDGDYVNVTYSIVDDVYVGVPDIRNISYPADIMGPDYVGTDVNFTLSYDTVNTDYVHVHIGNGTGFYKLGAKGNQSLNVQTLLNLSNGSYNENDNLISFQLKLIPYNTSGREVVSGKEEILTIKFYKGKFTIPRATVLNRLAEAFESQFYDIDASTPDDTSKYLTHLLHLGDGNNKVVTTWTGSNGTLILKLYEPLDTTVQPNQQVWISKLQSNPIIDTLTLVGVSEQFCPPLKGPNFGLQPDNGIGYKVYDDLLASGSATSTDLLNKYLVDQNIDTVKLNIQYVSGSTYLFENFTNFSSAEERVNNFVYKVKLIENYETKYNSLTASANNGSINASMDLNKALDSINEIKRKFDGFEYFLYNDVSSSLGYPKDVLNKPLLSTNNLVVAWKDSLIETASLYDSENVNYLVNNIPEFISEDYQNEEFITFLDMIGHHFDTIWCYINALNKNRKLEYVESKGMMNDMIYHMLESLGWEGRKAFDSQFLWEYAFGTNKDGTQKYSMPLYKANEEVWRRILTNLPYLLKNKGTARAMKAIMACYGVPQSMLTIMEFGGPQDPTQGGVTKFTYDDRTAALLMTESSSLLIPWHVVPSTTNYPEAIEFRIKPNTYGTYTLISGSGFEVNLIQTTGSFAKLDINLGSGTGSGYSYFETSGPNYPYIDLSIEYVLGVDLITGSLDFPISIEHYSNVLINRHDLGGNSSWYEVLLSTSDGHRIINSVSMSIFGSTDIWEDGTSLTLGGNGYNGNLDEFRLWNTPLQVSKFKNHTLFPDAINGNHISASSDDLLFRMDFEYPKDRTADNNIINVAISSQYGENYAYAQNFISASSYPYQYTPYDRTVTADIPSMGFGYGNKIRFENQYTKGGTSLFNLETAERNDTIIDLSYKTRVTQKAFDRAPIDSSRLGLFMSPTKELNMDILKAFGDFNIDNYIGDPGDEYKEQYSELKDLREYYFERLNRNINEYIRLIKYIDKSLFDVLHDVAPARANVSKGLLIEPHFLERSKTRWDKPTTEYNDIEADIVANEFNEIYAESLVKDALLDATEAAIFDFEYNNITGTILEDEVYYLEGTTPFYDSEIDYTFSGSLTADIPMWDASIQVPTGSASGELDSFTYQAIGMDANSLDIAGFGLYAKNGVGIVKTIDMHGNITSSRQIIDLMEKSYTQNISTQISGYPTTGAQPGDQVVYANVPITKTKYQVTLIPFYTASYGVPYQPSVGGTTISITPLDGYFPSHYRYKHSLSEGLLRSYHKGSTQDSTTTPDGLDPVQTFTTNPNILRVAKTGRGSGEPILEVQ
jgi:hypothetical protein